MATFSSSFPSRRLLLPMVTLAVVSAVPSPAFAQQRRNATRAPKLTALGQELRAGVVAKVGPGMLVLQLPKGQGELWAAMPAPNAVVEVWGTGSRDLMRPKQFVQCVVPLDDASKPVGPARQVIFAEGGMAEVAPLIEPGSTMAVKPVRRNGGRRLAGTYLVSGAIQQVEGETITVLAGRERFGILVPADAELRVLSRNVALAAEGDEVQVDGSYFQKGQLMVTSLKITLAKTVEPTPGR